MQKRTKVIIRNIIVSPLVLLSYVCGILVYFLSEIIEKLPYWKALPMSDEHQKIYDEKKEKERQEMIAALQSGAGSLKVDLPPGYGNVIEPIKYKEYKSDPTR